MGLRMTTGLWTWAVGGFEEDELLVVVVLVDDKDADAAKREGRLLVFAASVVAGEGLGAVVGFGFGLTDRLVFAAAANKLGSASPGAGFFGVHFFIGFAADGSEDMVMG